MKVEAFQKASSYYPEETEGYWKQHRSSFLASGLSRKKYCREHGANYDRFSYWLKKRSSEKIAARSEKEPSIKNNLLLPVHCKSAKIETSLDTLCTLNLKNGHSLTIHHERALSFLLEQWS